MSQPKPFDAEKVKDLSDRIVETEKQLITLKMARDKAEHEWRSADVRLSNLKTELTRAVEINLDHSIIHHPYRGEEIKE